MSPRAFHALARHPESEMRLFGVCLHRILSVSFLVEVLIGVAELEELQVGVLAVGIVGDTLQAAEENRLAHHIQVARKWVHDAYQALCGIAVQVFVVGSLRQGVVQNLVETGTHELLAHQVLQLMLLVFVALDDERGLQLFGHFHIIIAIHAQDIFHNVARTLNVHTIGRHFELQALGILRLDDHFERRNDALDGVVRNLLTNQLVHVIVLQIHVEVGQRLGIDILDFHRNLSASQFLAEQGSLLQGVDGAVGIDTALKAERGIRG